MRMILAGSRCSRNAREPASAVAADGVSRRGERRQSGADPQHGATGRSQNQKGERGSEVHRLSLPISFHRGERRERLEREERGKSETVRAYVALLLSFLWLCDLSALKSLYRNLRSSSTTVPR